MASCAGGLSRYARASSYLRSIRPSAGVARQAQQPANALPARGLLVRAAGMVVVDEDGSAFLESGVAHRAGVLLDLQEAAELLPGQAVPDELVRLVPSALGSGVNDPSVDGDALCESLAGSGHRLGSLATHSVPRGAGAMSLLARHPLVADRSSYTCSLADMVTTTVLSPEPVKSGNSSRTRLVLPALPLCPCNAAVSLVRRPYRGRTSDSCTGSLNDHSKASSLAGDSWQRPILCHATFAATPAPQPCLLRRASAAARTVPWCCCRRTA